MRKMAGLVMAGALALAFASPAAADTTGGGPGAAFSDGMTFSIVSTKVVAKVVVNITFDIACDPAPEGARWEDSYFTASVRQASGRAVATGSVDWYMRDMGSLCDGTMHRMTVAVPADYGSVPFKGGTAVAGLYGNASFYVETCDEWLNCDTTGDSRSASTGWVVVRFGR